MEIKFLRYGKNEILIYQMRGDNVLKFKPFLYQAPPQKTGELLNVPHPRWINIT